jgi:hypothetical protein
VTVRTDVMDVEKSDGKTAVKTGATESRALKFAFQGLG